MAEQLPGPLCRSQLGDGWIDSGTLTLSRSLPPGPVGVCGSPLSSGEKVAEAIRRSLPMLPSEARHQVMAMLQPESLAIILGTLLVWAGSHLFGVGEIVDLILLTVGFAVLGVSAFSGAQELYQFADLATHAQTQADLNRAAHHFAMAVNILGISVISALLLRRSTGEALSRGKPKIYPMPNVGKPPPAGTRPKVTRPLYLRSGALGETDWFGDIAVTRSQTLTEQRLTLYHEWVHSVLSPRFGPLRQLRAQLRVSGYFRSALLQYIEEAMAESYAQLRMYGLSKIFVGLRFPIHPDYVTVSQLASEGIAIGNIVVGGAQFTVTITEGDWEQP